MNRFDFLSCCSNARRAVGGQISIKTFLGSLKIVLEYLDQQMCNLDGIDTIKATFSEVVATEIRKAMLSSEIEETKQTESVDEGAQLHEARKEIEIKTKHIEELELLIQELQSSLRTEVDKPTFLHMEESTKTMQTSQTLDDELEEVFLGDSSYDEAQKKPQSRFTLRKRLASLFKAHNIGTESIRSTPTSCSETEGKVPEKSVEDASLGLKVLDVEMPETNNKKQKKKLIHFNNTTQEENKQQHSSQGLNDFNESFY